MKRAAEKQVQVLVSEKKHAGKYVALESFRSHRVVASGKTPEGVVKLSEKRGVPDPVILFVPKGDMTQIF